MRPNVTLTGGIRYDIQTPFKPFSNVMSSVTMASVCGRSGIGDGGLYSKCNFHNPNASGGATPEYILLGGRHRRYKTDLNNIAPSASIAWRPDVQSGFLRAMLGDPEPGDGARRVFGGLRTPGADGVHRPLRRQPRRHDLVEHDRERPGAGGPAGESWPVLLSQTEPPFDATAFNPDPTYPIPLAPTGPTASTPSRRTSRCPGAELDGGVRPVAVAATWRSRSATSATAATTSGRRSTTTRSAARISSPTGS